MVVGCERDGLKGSYECTVCNSLMRKEVNVTHSCFYQLLQPCLATILPQFTLLSLSLCHSFFPLWGTLSPDGCSLASGKNVLLLPIYIHLTSYTYAGE